MNKKSILKTVIPMSLIMGGQAMAALAVNIDPVRANPDAAVPTITDFISQNAASGLTASDAFLNIVGAGNNSQFHDTLSPGVSLGGFTVTSTGTAENSGFNAGVDAHNDLDPITEGYTFNSAGVQITFDGLLANSSAGDTITLAIWAIGDNIGQQSELTATYGGNTATEGNVQTTAYNDGVAPRNDATGSIPFVNFNFIADGVTDQITFDVASGGTSNTVLNAFSLAVTPAAIPEPSSTALLGLGFMSLALRRRR